MSVPSARRRAELALSQLRSLTLLDVGDPAKDFDHLLRWSALKTLESVRLRDERALVRGESLWAALRAASALRLGSGFLSSREVDALVENRSLDGLTTLDLRGNSLSHSDIARLRSAPHFARAEIIVDAPR